MHQRGVPTNQKSGRPHVTLAFTEAPLMRLSVGSLRQVVKRDLPIEFVPQQLTSYGGLELLHRYVRRLGLYPRLRRACADLGGDYGGARLSLLLLALFYVGARRVEHLKYLVGDPLVHRFSGLGRMPTARTVTNWLRRFTHATLRPLIQLNQELVLESLARLDVPRLTLDVDGTVVRTGATVAWAFRGFNPHHRKDLSYYPLVAHVAQTGHILRLKNRPGNVHDSKQSAAFLRELIVAVRARLGRSLPLEFRMDAAFFQRDVLRLLAARRCAYAIKVGYWSWLPLKQLATDLPGSFQLDTGVAPRRRSRKRTYTYVLRSMRTLRFTLVARAGRLARIGGRRVLRLTFNPATTALYTRLEQRLAA